VRSRALVLLIAPMLLVQAILPALAPASPPDPSWIPGIYDDADDDHVIALITSASGHNAPLAATDIEPRLPLIGTLAPSIERTTAVFCAFAVQSRAPPAS
jgi:hypothetical protein